MYMTQSDLDAAELELRDHDSAVMPAHWWWAARGEWVVILQQQRVDAVLPSLFAEDWTVGGCE
jgi:hypothetical protein